jgi:microcystin-dependent protein
MATPYVSEIKMFGGNFAPVGWMFCSGQTLPISENETLFNLIGTTYGGDGQQTFNLPNLQSRVPIHQGTGPGIGINHQLGEMGGTESVTLTTNQIPIHSHAPSANSVGGSDSPSGNIWGASTTGKPYSSLNPVTAMNNTMVAPAGGNQPHDNMIPFLCVSYIISLFGVFPNQN